MSVVPMVFSSALTFRNFPFNSSGCTFQLMGSVFLRSFQSLGVRVSLKLVLELRLWLGFSRWQSSKVKNKILRQFCSHCLYV